MINLLLLLGFSSIFVEVVFTCKDNEWSCDDGTCIDVTQKCNSYIDCRDGSDETFPLCRKIDCEGFKCLYGGCVASNATCDGITDCIDNSDEVLHKCRNESTFTECISGPYDIKFRSRFRHCNLLWRTCKNGQVLSNFPKCDGKVDCDDGSDETLETCATDQRECNKPYRFRCKYGACVDESNVCNGVNDCADGSDEMDGLCHVNKKTDVWFCDDGTRINASLKCNGAFDCPDASDESVTHCRKNIGRCVLPDYPANGIYKVFHEPKATPGQDLKYALLTYYCNPGYKLSGSSPYVNCTNGLWIDEQLQCNAQCELKKHPSIIYWCLPKGPMALEGAKECEELVPDGTTVQPKCRTNFRYTDGFHTNVRCIKGHWNKQIPICHPRCGLVTAQGDKLVVNGTSAKRGELPWQAAIYRKPSNNSYPYKQICGGSLVSDRIIISAAHCFTADKGRLLPAENYAVAVGKIYRPWNEMHDADAQKSDVERIIISEHYRGVETSYQDDIALVELVTPVEFCSYVLPVCLDFEPLFERGQLAVGETGKVAGWGLTSEDGKASPVLKVAELPYVDTNTCYRESSIEFQRFITSDKFCAGNLNGTTTLCQGDSGGGIVFLSRERGEARHYLRGIVSTKSRNEHLCNAHVYTTFTKLSKHQALIEDNLI